jgi:hypothetical protein
VALQMRSFNKEAMLWISDGRDEDYKIEPEGPFKYLINPDGLFPQAIPKLTCCIRFTSFACTKIHMLTRTRLTASSSPQVRS